jgi:hypothetical protein
MGQFETRIDDKPLEFGRKAPKKTIALLKALVAFGGHEVSEEKLTDALWPGEEADTARQSLSAAVHRLRRLLGEGMPCARVLVHCRSTGASAGSTRWHWTTVRSMSSGTGCSASVPGAFLGSDAGEPWALPMRERLRGKFVRVVERVGAGLRRTDISNRRPPSTNAVWRLTT